MNRLAAIVSSFNETIVGWSPDKTITNWNPSAKRLYGWTKAEIVGRPITELMPDDDFEEAEATCLKTREERFSGRRLAGPYGWG